MARRHHSLFPGALIALVLALAACSSSEPAASEDIISTEPPAAPTAEDSQAGDVDSNDVDSTEAATDESDSSDTGTDEGEEPTAGDDGVEELFPDVLDATATQADDGTWNVSATLSSPYDTPERYADAWRVLGPDGTEYGIRELAHDHASEQPFTRSQGGIEIPDDVAIVTIEGRDQVSGWGGATFDLTLER